jgi:hypothetical protein
VNKSITIQLQNCQKRIKRKSINHEVYTLITPFPTFPQGGKELIFTYFENFIIERQPNLSPLGEIRKGVSHFGKPGFMSY